VAITLTDKMIKEIADLLDSGMLCFYHIPTGELEYYPNELNGHGGFDEEPWQEAMDKIEENYQEYIHFEGPESHESFKIMEAFVDTIQPASIRQRFEDAISFKGPFQNFKRLLTNYPQLREEWFAYKEQEYIEYVEDQLESYNLRKKEE
jgi:hypothetical protein